MSGFKRSIKSDQPYLRELNFTVISDAIAGFSRYNITSITDNGTGLYTIIFSKPFDRACVLKSSSMMAADTTLFVSAVAYDRITVQVTDLAGANIATADFALCVLGSDFNKDF